MEPLTNAANVTAANKRWLDMTEPMVRAAVDEYVADEDPSKVLCGQLYGQGRCGMDIEEHIKARHATRRANLMRLSHQLGRDGPLPLAHVRYLGGLGAADADPSFVCFILDASFKAGAEWAVFLKCVCDDPNPGGRAYLTHEMHMNTELGLVMSAFDGAWQWRELIYQCEQTVDNRIAYVITSVVDVDLTKPLKTPTAKKIDGVDTAVQAALNVDTAPRGRGASGGPKSKAARREGIFDAGGAPADDPVPTVHGDSGSEQSDHDHDLEDDAHPATRELKKLWAVEYEDYAVTAARKPNGHVEDEYGNWLGTISYICPKDRPRWQMAVLCRKHNCKRRVEDRRHPNEAGAIEWLKIAETQTKDEHMACFDTFIVGG